ncbi:MAG: sulfatase [Lentisphaerae bacterium]|jgi:arylsulfatase A-like enzyme|nr:sulfatase [Lentisphaerota bacterium]MBT5607499.1 sulfatase [Lentisphaerota bacterium]MBT7059930.1 sulfatase [Lentisphaerota bacterium]MBT7840752.1 sulfatase [Lentisphaerota bacterium]
MMGSRTRREFLGSALGAAAALASSRIVAAETDQPRPNLVFVFPDQFRVFSMGFMNADPVVTPHLDRFAAESVVFSNAVSNFPICSPYRAMLFTGKWPYANGVYTNCNSGRPEIFLKPEERCFSDVLANRGYDAGYIGKYHLEFPTEEDAKYGEGRRGKRLVWDAYTPPGPRRHGFNFWHSYGCCDKHLKPHYWPGNTPIDKPTEVNEWSPKHETDVATEYILNRGGAQRRTDCPFALFVAFNPPHPPYNQVPDQYRENYQDVPLDQLLRRPNLKFEGKGRGARGAAADYFAAVTGVDEQFGRILAAIDTAGLRDNTIIVFTSDHGEMMGSHGRMGKGNAYEEAFRIPLIIRYPKHLAPKTDPLHINVPDMMPTLLGMMGLGKDVPAAAQGSDHSETIRNSGGPRPSSTFFVMGPKDPNSGTRGIRTDRYTFVVRKGTGQGPKLGLFDRQSDPYQLTDIAAEKPQLCRKLVADLNVWLTGTSDPWEKLDWPIRAANAFSVQRTTDGFGTGFEVQKDGALTMTPASPLATLSETKGEVISGARSLRADTQSSATTYHEFLRFEELLQASRHYEATYRYRVLAADERTRFYTVVRSTSDIKRKAARIYWNEEPGEVRTRTFRFKTSDINDHHLMFGIQYRGAIIIDSVTVKECDDE